MGVNVRSSPNRDSYNYEGAEGGSRLGSAIINATLLIVFLAVLIVVLKAWGVL